MAARCDRRLDGQRLDEMTRGPRGIVLIQLQTRQEVEGGGHVERARRSLPTDLERPCAQPNRPRAVTSARRQAGQVVQDESDIEGVFAVLLSQR